MKRALGAIAVVAALSACSSEPQSTGLQEAADTCAEFGYGQAVVQDGGASVTFNTQGEDDVSGDSIELVACFTVETAMPDSTVDRIDQTSSMDGQQHAAWDGYEAYWGYHPSDGLFLTISEVEAG